MRKVALIAALFALASTQGALAGSHYVGDMKQRQGGEPVPATAHSNQRVRTGDQTLAVNTHMKAFLPSDIRAVAGQEVSYHCSESGQRVQQSSTNCLDYRSASTGEAYRIEFRLQDGTAERVFRVQGKQVTLHAQVDPNDIYHTLYTAPKAQQYAQANGAATVTATQTSEPAPVATSTEDCSKGNFVQRGECWARKGVGK